MSEERGKKVGLIAQYRFVFLFLTLIVFFLTKALSQDHQTEDIANTLFLFIIVYSLYVIGHEKRFLIIVLSLFALAELTVLLSSYFIDSNLLLVLNILFGLLFLLTMTIACLNYTLHDERITVTTLFGSLCAYLFVGLTWAYAYLFIDVIDPQSFGLLEDIVNFDDKLEQFIYYSFVTLTTLGFGDVSPLTSYAMTVTYLQAIFGQLYLVILVSRLVGMYMGKVPAEKPPQPD